MRVLVSEHARAPVGPELLEVITIVRDDGSDLAIHAMKMRLKYELLLSGG